MNEHQQQQRSTEQPTAASPLSSSASVDDWLNDVIVDEAAQEQQQRQQQRHDEELDARRTMHRLAHEPIENLMMMMKKKKQQKQQKKQQKVDGGDDEEDEDEDSEASGSQEEEAMYKHLLSIVPEVYDAQPHERSLLLPSTTENDDDEKQTNKAEMGRVLVKDAAALQEHPMFKPILTMPGTPLTFADAFYVWAPSACRTFSIVRPSVPEFVLVVCPADVDALESKQKNRNGTNKSPASEVGMLPPMSWQANVEWLELTARLGPIPVMFAVVDSGHVSFFVCSSTYVPPANEASQLSKF
eukprot:TRINITY_DN66226_c13_g1_i1.p1 TRINITY_DN66226_c13_g1~~TRINITY_DN66226_c13_g1_i1.p1  ORF type:complete len:299 (-),score=149.68 TRINITY_DN66226_c13_g1_i1:8-904(-)